MSVIENFNEILQLKSINVKLCSIIVSKGIWITVRFHMFFLIIEYVMKQTIGTLKY